MFRFRDLVDGHRKEIATLLSAEHGKTVADASGEVARGLENAEFATGAPHLLKGGYSEQAATGVDVYSISQPLGVVAGITPFNFPAMVPMWMFCNALVAGNTLRAQAQREGPVGLAAAGRAPAAGPACRTACFNVVQGDKVAVDALLADPDVQAISFVGSTPVAQAHLRDRHPRGQARAGARRREEPHGRAARRRRAGRRRRGDLRRIRLGGRAVHGRLGRRGGRRCRRPAGRGDRRADRRHPGRAGVRPRRRDGPADHRRPPRPRAVLSGR